MSKQSIKWSVLITHSGKKDQYCGEFASPEYEDEDRCFRSMIAEATSKIGAKHSGMLVYWVYKKARLIEAQI